MGIRMLRIVGLAGLVLASGAVSSVPPPPDLIVVNARIYTADARHRVVSAMAVQGGKIIFTGSEEAARKLAGPQTELRDLGGKLVLPGLIDSHMR